MTNQQPTEYRETIVIGGGQAGLSVGYYLSQQQLPFVILDAAQRVGDSWRNRWDSLRLFTSAEFDGLVGMPVPGDRHAFLTKDQMADYLESYTARFALPVRSGVKVDRLWREGDHFRLTAGDRTFVSDNVVVAMSDYQQPRTPAFASELAPGILQLHSSQYRNPSQLQEGDALVVGAGNSGAEIAVELVGSRHTWLSGREPGAVPFRMDSAVGRAFLARLILRGLFHRVMTVDTPMGRRARANSLGHATPLIRVKPDDLAAAGVQRVPRTVGGRDGLPLLEDGRTLAVRNVIWCTGFAPSFGWIDLPVFGQREPLHERGIVPSQPGLYFVGLHFLYAMSSSMIHGVGRDADRVVRAILAARETLPKPGRSTSVAPAAPYSLAEVTDSTR
jgi:putative flavoprotein involved in K+ transport